jgi:hypothetical protein
MTLGVNLGAISTVSEPGLGILPPGAIRPGAFFSADRLVDKLDLRRDGNDPALVS